MTRHKNDGEEPSVKLQLFGVRVPHILIMAGLAAVGWDNHRSRADAAQPAQSFDLVPINETLAKMDTTLALINQRMTSDEVRASDHEFRLRQLEQHSRSQVPLPKGSAQAKD